MKIVHVSTLYYPFIGGIEFALQQVSEEQAKLGHEVFVVTSNSGGRAGIEVMNGVNVVRVLSLRSMYTHFISPLEVPKTILKGADVIHGWCHTYYFVYKLLKYGKYVLKKPSVIYFIGVDYLRGHYNPLIRFFGFQYQRTITKLFANFTDIAIVTNYFEKVLLEERYGVESVVLPHGVSEQYFKTPSMEDYFRSKYDVQGRIISYVGRIHPTKGLDLLIKAFAEVAKKESDAILVIAGKGKINYLKKCLELIRVLGLENRVKYLGYISEEDKIGLIDSSEFVVLPSRHAGESYPLIIDEVKARRKPLIVTTYGTLPHRIVNLVEGIVVDAEIHSLAKGMCYALSHIQDFHVLLKPFTWREVADKLLTLYQNSLMI